MPEMDALHREMTATLSQARQVVEDELELLTRAAAPDMDRLAHLGRSVGELSFNADSLLMLMLERDADSVLLNVVEALVDFFRDTDEQIAALLKAGRG